MTADSIGKALGGRKTGAGKGVGTMTHLAPLDPAPRRPLANGRTDFAEINATALAVLPALLARWARLLGADHGEGEL